MDTSSPVSGIPVSKHFLSACETFIGDQWNRRSPAYSLTWKIYNKDIFSRVCFCLQNSSNLFRQLTLLNLQLVDTGVEHFCFQFSGSSLTDDCHGMLRVNLWINQPRIDLNYTTLKNALKAQHVTIQKDCNQYTSELMANNANRILQALIAGSLEDKSC